MDFFFWRLVYPLFLTVIKFGSSKFHFWVFFYHVRRYVKQKLGEIHPIDTKDQLAGIFTEPLDEVLLIHLN